MARSKAPARRSPNSLAGAAQLSQRNAGSPKSGLVRCRPSMTRSRMSSAATPMCERATAIASFTMSRAFRSATGDFVGWGTSNGFRRRLTHLKRCKSYVAGARPVAPQVGWPLAAPACPRPFGGRTGAAQRRLRRRTRGVAAVASADAGGSQRRRSGGRIAGRCLRREVTRAIPGLGTVADVRYRAGRFRPGAPAVDPERPVPIHSTLPGPDRRVHRGQLLLSVILSPVGMPAGLA